MGRALLENLESEQAAFIEGGRAGEQASLEGWKSASESPGGCAGAEVCRSSLADFAGRTLHLKGDLKEGHKAPREGSLRVEEPQG